MKNSFLVSFTILLTLSLWMFSGYFSPTQSSTSVELETSLKKANVKLMSVHVQHSRSQKVTREVVIQGQVEPWKSVQVPAETVGVVSRIMARKGQRVKTGEPLLELNMDEREAQRNEAQALLKLRQTEYSGVKKLQKSGLQSKTQLAVAKAQLEAAKAMLQKIEVDIRHTQIRAPFSGVINDKFVVPGDFLERGDPAMTLVDDSRLLAVGNVPQQNINMVRTGLSATVKLITGDSMSGVISFVSATAESASRSYRIEIEVDNREYKFIAGISGEIHIPVEEIPGHFLSPAMLALNDAGELGVKTIDSTSHVVFHAVKIIHTTQKGAWVTGLPDSVQVISLGQGYVRAGDEVMAVFEISDDSGNVKSTSTSPALPGKYSADSTERG